VAAATCTRRGESPAGGLLDGRPADPACDDVEGVDGRGERDPLELAGGRRQALDRRHQVHAACGVDHGVHLVEDHRAHVAQQGAAGRRGEQDVEALGGGDQDLGGLLAIVRRSDCGCRQCASPDGERDEPAADHC
jgi:hypothetical protein